MTDPGDDIDSDFIMPDGVRDPREFDPYEQTLRVIGRCLDLLEKIVDQNGLKP